MDEGEGFKEENMRKLMVMVAAAALAGIAVQADEAKPDAPKAGRKALIQQAQMKRFGGLVARPDSYRGRIAVVNYTGGYDDEITKVIDEFTKNIKIRIESSASAECPTIANAKALKASTGAEAALFVVKDETLPNLLAAPEDGWTIVNIVRMDDGMAKEPVVKRRVRCELARGLAMVAGAMGSTFPNSLMGAIQSPAGLDAVSDEMPPMEVFARMPTYLKGLGITPLVKVPYRVACREGWAAQPTNDYQKAVWNEVHAIPDKPLTIEFDPKKDK